MDRPRLTGSEAELHSLAEWLRAMERLRDQLHDEQRDAVGGAVTPFRELAKDVLRAENRVRAHVGLPPLSH